MVTDNTNITTTDYAGGRIYENGSLKFINHEEGYIEPNGAGGYAYVYQYKDHLGNVRLSYSDTNGDGAISNTVLFEDGFESASGWDSTGALYGDTLTAYDDTFSLSGTYSAKISTPEGDDRYVHSNTWIAIANDQPTAYTYSGWFYSDGPGVRVHLFMNTQEETEYYTEIAVFYDYDTKDQWVYFEKTVDVPAHIDKLNIRIESFWGTPGSVWFDDIRLKRADSEIRSEKNYYPFGLTHRGYNGQTQGTYHPYGFGGKEEQAELDLNWLDFLARNYDAALGRWMNLDPLAEDMRRHSPYNYAFNNPIYFIDPDGMMPFGNGGLYEHNNFDLNAPHTVASTYVDRSGKIIEHIDDNDPNIYLVLNPENGLSQDWVIGTERPGVSYNEGDHLSLSDLNGNYRNNAQALPSEFRVNNELIQYNTGGTNMVFWGAELLGGGGSVKLSKYLKGLWLLNLVIE